eukprot:1159566-Pelagomonas_calceolata.AAC.16
MGRWLKSPHNTNHRVFYFYKSLPANKVAKKQGTKVAQHSGGLGSKVGFAFQGFACWEFLKVYRLQLLQKPSVTSQAPQQIIENNTRASSLGPRMQREQVRISKARGTVFPASGQESYSSGACVTLEALAHLVRRKHGLLLRHVKTQNANISWTTKKHQRPVTLQWGSDVEFWGQKLVFTPRLIRHVPRDW